MNRHLSKLVIESTARTILGIVFIYSGVVKGASLPHFADSIASYRILPFFVINLLAMSLPPLEIICGLLVVTGFCVRAGLLAIFVMLVVFVAALLSAVVRGLPNECGCFGESSWLESKSWAALFRDLVLLSAAGYLYVKSLIKCLKRNHKPLIRI